MVPEPEAKASGDAAWARKPEPAPRAEQEPEPAPELRRQPDQDPVRDPEPAPEASDPPTARLDDLLSADPEDESR
jgi:hypothetical protein